MKNRLITAGLAFFFGSLGAHKFYLGKTFQGILYFIFSMTFIPTIISIVEAIQLLGMSDDDFDYKYNVSNESKYLKREKLELEKEKIKIEKLKLKKQRLEIEKKMNQNKIPAKEVTGEQADDLAAWHDLLEKGLIDQKQYEEKRKIILGLND